LKDFEIMLNHVKNNHDAIGAELDKQVLSDWFLDMGGKLLISWSSYSGSRMRFNWHEFEYFGIEFNHRAANRWWSG
jgi:hypothetical protein